MNLHTIRPLFRPLFGHLTGRLAVLAVALVFAAPVIAQTDELQDVNAMLKNGQFDQALTRVNSYLASKPKDARGRFLKGLILAEQNKSNEAITVFTDLTRDFPDLPGPYNNLAVLHASQGQYDKARMSLEQAIRTHPSYATAHENLGDIYAKLASQSYDKALQLDKGNSTAQSKLTMLRELFPASTKPPAPTVAAAGKPAVTAPTTKPYDPTAPAPATATPAAVAPAAPVAATKPAAAGNSDEVLAALNAWAQAWAKNDVAGYLGSYGPDFKTPKGEPRAAWEAERSARIAPPRKIAVSVAGPSVEFVNPTTANVKFTQNYSSGTLKATNVKIIVMTKAGDKWLIQQERNVGG